MGSRKNIVAKHHVYQIHIGFHIWICSISYAFFVFSFESKLLFGLFFLLPFPYRMRMFSFGFSFTYFFLLRTFYCSANFRIVFTTQQRFQILKMHISAVVPGGKRHKQEMKRIGEKKQQIVNTKCVHCQCCSQAK